MPDVNELQKYDADDLLKELRARETEKALVVENGANVRMAGAGLSEALRSFDTITIARALTDKQKAIYGVDDRQDLFEVADQAILADADTVVSLFRDNDVTDNGDGTSTLATDTFGTAFRLCTSEKFKDQPTGAFCSGFLVAPDIVATAGHCANSDDVATIKFVFGYRMVNAGAAQVVISNDEIYSGQSVIDRREEGNGPDWALVRLDRPVTNHRIAPIRTGGRISNTQHVHVIGHPSGIPIKYAAGARVRKNTDSAFFVANLDTYGGNSGSPVFNSDTHEVEGILVRGETDFVSNNGCKISLVCPTTGCRGEDCTRTTEFAPLV